MLHGDARDEYLVIDVFYIKLLFFRDVLPHLYKFLKKSATDSHLKDTGSAYRVSPEYQLQVAILTAMPTLSTDLMLDEEKLEEAMSCAQIYLSKNQPKPLQVGLKPYNISMD